MDIPTTERQVVSLPVGQACLKAGFKPITIDALHERFACDAVTRQEERKARKELRRRGYDVVRAWHGVVEGRKGYWCPKWEFIDYKLCTVKTQPLDEYIADTIPDRCLTSIARARELGIDTFYVAYPVLAERPLTDPVIVGICGEDHKGWDNCSLVEVDMWE